MKGPFAMNPTRRSFLRAAAMAALASKLSLIAFTQQRLQNQTEVMDDESLSIFDGISPETFEQWVGSSFQLSRSGKQVGTVVLMSVKKTGSTDKPDATKPAVATVRAAAASSTVPSIYSFSLQFRGRGNALPQDTYTLTHSWLGKFPLFLVPSGPGARQSTYTATFNILNPPQSNE